MSLRARLTVGVTCLLAISIGAGFVVAYFAVQTTLHHQLDLALKARAVPFVASGNRARQALLGRVPVRPTAPTLGGANGYIQIVRADGTIQLTAGEQTKLPVGGAQAVASGQRRAFFTDATVAGTHLRIYTTRLGPNAALEIARPLTEVDRVLSRLRLLFVLIFALAVAAAGLVALLLSKAALRPVRQLTDDAERIAVTGDLRDRTDQSRSDELGRLAVAFNTMLDALAASVGAQRQLVADASHELRTPLTTARTNLELMELHDELPAEQRKRILSEAIAELAEMTTLIDELVELARGENLTIDKTHVRLDLIASDVVALAERRTGRQFETELEPTTVDGSTPELGRAISNLVDNALKWGPADEPVDVDLRDGALRIRDRGPGIPAEDLPHVFDRFYRAAAARTLPGSGLGLAIVRQIAEAHGGSVTAESAPGGGSVFTLRIPTIDALSDE